MVKAMIKYTILIKILLYQISDKGENVWGWVDAVLYMLASDHVLEAIFKLFFYYLG